KIEGLIGKTFIGNVDTGNFGGVYYFKNQASLDAFLGSELLAGVKAHPNLANFTTHQFDVAGISSVTNGLADQRKTSANRADAAEMHVLIANYELNEISLEDHAALGKAVAPDFSPDKIEGLIGKTFIGNVDTGNFGGVYYFETKASLDAFLGSELLAGVKAHPNLANFTTRQFGVAGVSALTNGIPVL
ncbi:MAG: YdhR family protein, partial [Lutibacter sp.]|nr:YdhR family protein [Lutibacter sp.]